MQAKNIEFRDGVFVLSGPVDVGALMESARDGLPEIRQNNNGEVKMKTIEEINQRVQELEKALARQEQQIVQGIDRLAENLIVALRAALEQQDSLWYEALDDQERRIAEKVGAIMREAAAKHDARMAAALRAAMEQKPPANWWQKLLDPKAHD